MLGATEAARRWARERQKKERAKGYAEGYAEGRALALRNAPAQVRPIADNYTDLAYVQEFVAEIEARCRSCSGKRRPRRNPRCSQNSPPGYENAPLCNPIRDSIVRLTTIINVAIIVASNRRAGNPRQFAPHGGKRFVHQVQIIRSGHGNGPGHRHRRGRLRPGRTPDR